MNISFNGIKNVGFETRKYVQNFDNDEYGDKFKEAEDEYFLNVELTDDEYGNDLSEFRRHISKTGLKNYSHPYNPNMLSLAISKDVIESGFSRDVDYQVFINEADKELAVNDNNLHMFSYLAKLMNKILKMPDKDLKADKEYLEEDAAESVIIGEDLKDTYGKAYNYEIENIHSPYVVKNGAKKMLSLINDIMFDYFNMDNK